MALIGVDPAALRAAAGSIADIAVTFTAVPAPAVTVMSVQTTAAAVRAVHAGADSADCTMAARLRSTAYAMAVGGTAFATAERASTEAVAMVSPGAG